VKRFVWLFALIQVLLGLRVFARMARTAGGTRIEPVRATTSERARIAVILPVLNEICRIGPCLRSLKRQSIAPARIVVVDGGSVDGTELWIRRAMVDDARIVLVNAAPVPDGINGKGYGLARGLEAAGTDIDWVLTIDADVRLQPNAIASILAFARHSNVRALSVATSQRITDALLAAVHPAMLTTLVYRFGIPGRATTRVDEVQANGQCFLVDRHVLEQVGGFDDIQRSISEDVTLARSIAATGEPVGFFEAGDLVDVEMYRSAADAWHNWPRSLPVQDRFSAWKGQLGLAECVLVQAAPLWLFALGLPTGGARSWFTQLQAAMLIGRLGVLAGTARAYPDRPWTYWLSPVTDLPVTVEIIRRSRRRTHRWRGRTIVAGERR
jgi:dolichol-phosphate mannosyltransferase